MENPCLVSILINNYNYGHFLRDAIDSALNQTYDRTEVIVVDDGSTDNSREIIASYGDKIIPILKENGGQASAFNAGFAACQGEIISFLDSDDLFLPEKVAEVVAAFGDRLSWGWCFHLVKFINSKETDIKAVTSNLESSDKGTIEEYDVRSQIKKGKIKNFPFPPTSGLCFRRSHLQQILPMPEAESVSLNDSYLIYTSLGLNKGIFLNKELGLYRIHDLNAYGSRVLPGTDNYAEKMKKKLQQKARIMIMTGYWMGVNFPAFSKLANYQVGAGIGLGQRYGCIEPEHQKLVKNYLAFVSPLEKVGIYARAFYTYLKHLRDKF